MDEGARVAARGQEPEAPAPPKFRTLETDEPNGAGFEDRLAVFRMADEGPSGPRRVSYAINRDLPMRPRVPARPEAVEGL